LISHQPCSSYTDNSIGLPDVSETKRRIQASYTSKAIYMAIIALKLLR